MPLRAESMNGYLNGLGSRIPSEPTEKEIAEKTECPICLTLNKSKTRCQKCGHVFKCE